MPPQALELLLRGRSPLTHRSYKGKVSLYLAFCREAKINPLASTQLDIVHYVYWLGKRGTIAAENLQPYLSCINQLHSDLELEPPALGPLVSLAKRGLTIRQVLLSGDKPDERPFLPAAHAVRFIEEGARALGLPVFSPALARRSQFALRALPAAVARITLKQLSAARVFLAPALGFTCANRAGTSQGALCCDVSCVAPERAGGARRIDFRVRKAKGKDGQPRYRVLSIPVPDDLTSPLFGLWLVLSVFLAAKRRLCPALAKPDAQLWRLPCDSSSCTFGPAMQSTWLQAAAAHIGAAAPFGQPWTSHALRHGAASAMAAIEVPFYRIRNHGGWAMGRQTLEKTYMHPSCLPSKAAWALFGHLRALSLAGIPMAAAASA
jgi:hypothetical protein